METRLTLQLLCSAVSEDVTKGIILGKTNATNKIFRDISNLSYQFKLDTVLGFDIRQHDGEKTLFVHLAHWGIGQ